MRSRLLSLFFVSAGWIPFGTARAQLVPEFKPPKANCCLQFSAQALADHTQLTARQIAEEAMKIAGKMCIYTNDRVTIEEL